MTNSIGLVGGLGPAATIHYYRECLARSAHPLDIVITHADVARVFQHVGAGDLQGLAEYLSGFIGRLSRAGCNLAAISAVMPHICMPILREIAPVPLVDIVETTRAALLARRWSRVALFGTRAVSESGMFGRLEGIDVIRLRAEEIEAIHAAYVSIVERGEANAQLMTELIQLGSEVQGRERLDAIVMAGTDLSPAFKEETRLPFPILDCTSHHVEAILAVASFR